MSECKHGLRQGCSYCHVTTRPPTAVPVQPGQKRRSRSAKLSEQMNDRMTSLQKRLRQIRGE
jgi:hypothetical protein